MSKTTKTKRINARAAEIEAERKASQEHLNRLTDLTSQKPKSRVNGLQEFAGCFGDGAVLQTNLRSIIHDHIVTFTHLGARDFRVTEKPITELTCHEACEVLYWKKNSLALSIKNELYGIEKTKKSDIELFQAEFETSVAPLEKESLTSLLGVFLFVFKKSKDSVYTGRLTTIPKQDWHRVYEMLLDEALRFKQRFPSHFSLHKFNESLVEIHEAVGDTASTAVCKMLEEKERSLLGSKVRSERQGVALSGAGLGRKVSFGVLKEGRLVSDDDWLLKFDFGNDPVVNLPTEMKKQFRFAATDIDELAHSLSDDDWDELSRLREKMLHERYSKLIFGDKKPTLFRFNKWLSQLPAIEIANPTKRRYANAVQYFMGVFDVDIFFQPESGTEIPCTITTSTSNAYSTYFRLRKVGKRSGAIYERVSFPLLAAK